VEAENERLAAEEIRNQGQWVLSLLPAVSQPTATPASLWSPRYVLGLLARPTIGTQSRFFLSLATSLHAGMSLSRSLNILAEQGPWGFRQFSQQAAQRVDRGERLSQSMSEHPELFDLTTVEMVRAAEISGHLEQTFRDMAEHLEQELKSILEMVKGAVLPIAETFFFLVLGVALGLFPGSVLVGAGVVVVAGFLGARVVLKLPGVSTLFGYVKSCLPLVGGIARHFAVARFCRAGGALYRAGVSLPESFHLAGEACGNPFLKGQAQAVVPALQQGVSLKDVLPGLPFLPRVVKEELMTGAESGTLDEAFQRSAAYCSASGHNTLSILMKVLPVVLVVLYCASAFFVLSGKIGEIGNLYQEASDWSNF